MKKPIVFSLLILTNFAICQTDSCITPTQRAAIVLTDLVTSDTLWFGFHPLGTCGVDSILCGEATEWPPPPPMGVLYARWSLEPVSCISPPRFDYRGYVSPADRDTHWILLRRSESQLPVTVRWSPDSVTQMCDSAKLWYSNGTYLIIVPMHRDSSLIVHNSAFDDTYLKIIRYGQRVTAVSPEGPGIPTSLSLFQNFPNPFNPSTVLRFQLTTSCFVTLMVYDMLGRRVAALEEGHLRPGVYERTFNAAGLASGVYLGRLTASRSIRTTKMLVIQ